MNDAFLTTLRYTLDDVNLEYQPRQFFNRTSFDYMSNDDSQGKYWANTFYTLKITKMDISQ